MLTEREIFDQMKNQLRSAIADCKLIAETPVSGVHFIRLRKSLKLIEGCCRQAAHWREDSRWLGPAMHMERAHQIAREWLNRPSVKAKKLFTSLGAALSQILKDLERLETRPSGRIGSIIDPRIGGSPLNKLPFRRMPSGLILPAGVR